MLYQLLKKAKWCPSGDGFTVETVYPGIYSEEHLRGLSNKYDFIDIFSTVQPPILVPLNEIDPEPEPEEKAEVEYEVKVEVPGVIKAKKKKAKPKKKK